MANRNIIAIGGSAGSGDALRRILGNLPADLSASLFISTHVPSGCRSHLVEGLREASRLPICNPVEGQPVEAGQVYVAVPDFHLLVIDGKLRLGDGPRENMARPAIDPMMRSVALCYGPRAVGVVLTGMLSDGASGLRAIQQAGGTTVVQHPLDALHPSMPVAAMKAAQPNHLVTADEIAGLLAKLALQASGPGRAPGDDLKLDVEVAAGARFRGVPYNDPSSSRRVGETAPFIPAEPPSHWPSPVDGQLDEAVCVAMRVMEERLTLVEQMAVEARASGRESLADHYDLRAVEYRHHAVILRSAAQLSAQIRWAQAAPLSAAAHTG